ncbi:hypothetical protein ACODUL_09235 [Stenotrophomonas maltophilia]
MAGNPRALVEGIAAAGRHQYFAPNHTLGADDGMAQHLADLAALQPRLRMPKAHAPAARTR